MISDHDDRRVVPTAPGVWVPLTEAVDEIATLRRLVYRLVGDAKLRSCEGMTGEIEVWIRDDDLDIESTVRPFSVFGPRQSAAMAECSHVFVGQ